MSDARRLVKIIQEAGKPNPNEAADLVIGIVQTVSPLSVKIDKIVLTETFVVLPNSVAVPAVADRVRMLRCGGGQKYYILDNLDTTGGGVVTVPVATSAIVGGVKSGTDITVDSNGNVSVVDDSHEHSNKVNTSSIGINGGVAQLDTNGLVPASQLPAFVNDVLEYATLSVFPSPGEAGIIYVALNTNKSYRWSGTQYILISSSLSIGETTDSAFAGDRGKALEVAMASILSDALLAAHPIGSVYMNVASTNPHDLFGGTWAALPDRFLIGASSTYAAGVTGGTTTKTIAAANLPSHVHTMAHTHGDFTSGVENANHTHIISHDHGACSTGNPSANHTHNFTGSSNSAGNHNHSQNAHDHSLGPGQSFGVDFGGNAGGGATFRLAVAAVNTNTYQGAYGIGANTATNNAAGDHSHTVSGATDGMSADHTHTVDLPNFSGNSGYISNTHQHTTTITAYSGNTGSVGSGTALDIMPPYLPVYMWKRTA